MHPVPAPDPGAATVGRTAGIESEAQLEARALGDPTRHRLFCYLVEAPDRVGVAELTQHVRLNHNAVRQHLAVLTAAGLVTGEVEDRNRPGRPRLLYRPHPEVAGRWGTPGPYVWLADLLSQAIRRQASPREVGHQEGHRRAAELSGAGDPVDRLEAEMMCRGFRPSRVDRRRTVNFVLGRCPFADVAAKDPTTVCQLHLGLAEGLTEGLGDLTVDKLIAKNPHRAGCRLMVRRLVNEPSGPP